MLIYAASVRVHIVISRADYCQPGSKLSYRLHTCQPEELKLRKILAAEEGVGSSRQHTFSLSFKGFTFCDKLPYMKSISLGIMRENSIGSKFPFAAIFAVANFD